MIVDLDAADLCFGENRALLYPFFLKMPPAIRTGPACFPRGFSTDMFLAIGMGCYLLIVFFSRCFFTIFNPENAALIDFMQTRSPPYFCGFFPAVCYTTRATGKALAVSLARSIV